MNKGVYASHRGSEWGLGSNGTGNPFSRGNVLLFHGAQLRPIGESGGFVAQTYCNSKSQCNRFMHRAKPLLVVVDASLHKGPFAQWSSQWPNDLPVQEIMP